MTIQRMDHVGIIVEDLDDALAFFVELGMEVQGRIQMEGGLVDRLLALDGVKTDFAFLRTPDGKGQLEVIQFLSPPSPPADMKAPAHALGLRHLCFAVDDIEGVLARLQARGAALVGELVTYESSYKLCYVRGPSGIIVELAQQLG